MSRIEALFLVCVALAVTGLAAILNADSLATTWYAENAGASFGTTDPAARRGYYALGLALVGLGGAGMVMTGWRWVASGGTRELSRG